MPFESTVNRRLTSSDFRHNAQWISAGVILVLLRLCRRWNQSGQKHQGSLDIAKTLANSASIGPYILWALIVLTYIEFGRMLYRFTFRASGRSKAMSVALTLLVSLVSGTFKVIFAASDTPELLGSGLDVALILSHRAPNLVLLARGAFVLLGLSIIVAASPSRHKKALKCL